VREFLAMGGYAAYVWTAFGLTAVVLVINIVGARREARQTRARLQARLARQQNRSKS